VSEFLAGRQGGGTGGENPQLRESVGANFQQPRGVAQLMDFVKDHDTLRAVPKEHLRIADHVRDGRQIAVEVENALFAEALGQSGLATATNAAKPGNRDITPDFLNTSLPEGSFNHVSELYLWSR